MKYVYVVSDSFLKPMVKESEKFSFAVKGYCSIPQGFKNLKYSNMNDILGFAIVLNELPEDLSMLIALINRLNMIATDKPVILAVYDGDGMDVLSKYIEYDNLKFHILKDFEDMTDLIIRQGIYGYILKSVFKPYSSDEVEVFPTLHSHKGLKYIPLFSNGVMKLTEEIDKTPDLESSLKIDKVLKEFEESNEPILYLLRKLQIIVYYNKCLPVNAEKDLEKLIIQSSFKDKINYRCLLSLIKEGRL